MVTKTGLPEIGNALAQIHVERLIDGSGRPSLQDAIVEIEGGLIRRVGRRQEFRIGEELPVLAGGHATLIPGLVDCHVHATLPSDGRALVTQAQEPDELLALTAVSQLGRHLRAGVTTVRDCAAPGRTMFRVRDAARRGDFPAPRVLLAGRAITHKDGHLSWAGQAAESKSAVRRAVRVLVAEGADVIKIVASGGGTGVLPPYEAAYTPDELAAAVRTAHELGRPTLAHARATVSIQHCIAAGVDTIAHVEFLSPGPLTDMGGAGAPTGLPRLDPVVAEMLAASTALLDLNPQSSGWDTVVRLRLKRETAGLSIAEDGQLMRLSRYFENMLAVISGLRELGLAARMAFGSDAGPFDTEFGHLEYNVALACQAGLSPMEALLGVTRNAALVCGLEGQVGMIAPGHHADMILLAGDPLDDIGHLARPLAVFLAGRRVV